MDLREYLISKDGRPSKEGGELLRVAASAGISPGTLYMVALGHKTLSPRAAVMVARATEHVVGGKSMCPDFPWDESAATHAARAPGRPARRSPMKRRELPDMQALKLERTGAEAGGAA